VASAQDIADMLPLPVLQGERCLLRALAASDAPSLRRHADNPNVWINLFEGFPSPYLDEHARAWCEREAGSGQFGYVWGIVADGEVVGCIALEPELRAAGVRCNAEIGYWIGESFWRRGIASDAVRQVVDWAFAALPALTRIHAPIYARSAGSQAVVRRCGFVQEGVMRASRIKAGEVIDCVSWAVIRPACAARPANIDLALASSVDVAMERP